jgi:hypothetical protein
MGISSTTGYRVCCSAIGYVSCYANTLMFQQCFPRNEEAIEMLLMRAWKISVARPANQAAGDFESFEVLQACCRSVSLRKMMKEKCS